jgi:hypothetical protein
MSKHYIRHLKNESQIRDTKRCPPKVHNLCRELARPGIALHFHSLATARPDKPLEVFYQDERLHRTAERWDDLVAAM